MSNFDYTQFAKPFVIAARSLYQNFEKVGYTGNGLRRLDFRVNGKTFGAIEQNKDKASTPGMLARDGARIVQIRDDERNGLIGFVNLEDESFNIYTPSGGINDVVDIAEVEKAVGGVDNVKIKGANSVQPTSTTMNTGQPRSPVQLREQGRNQQQPNRNDADPFGDIFSDNKAA